jgi:hypothetical protein
MADLTASANLRFMGEVFTEEWVLDNSAAQSVYKGQPMIIDQSEDTVYLRGFVDATTVAATDIFVGIAAEDKTVATTDTETANKIKVFVEPTIVGFKSAVFSDADVGDTVYMSDSATLSATAGDNPMIGKLIRVLDGYAFVACHPPPSAPGHKEITND